MTRFVHFSFALLAFLTLSACGDSEPFDFTGTWDGSFNELDNTCPFAVNQSLGTLFPMNVSKDANQVFTVTASNGDSATGSQGEGESISFSAKGAQFGNVGSTAPYTCTVSPYLVSYLEQGENLARTTVLVTFRDCTEPGNSRTLASCSALYSGTATKR
jgi:hypothetical protein